MLQPSMLQKYSLFGGLVEEQIEGLLPFMHEEKFKPEDFIITEGKTNDKIFFLIEGQVAVSKKDIVLTRFSEGEAFGEMEVLDVMPAAASIKALTPVTVMSISNKSLREIYKKDVTTFTLVLMNLARDLVRRLRKMDEKFASSPPILY
ncbi:MAG: cyclic nucleotide-binding domain-containing protein [Treponema sp.]|nr:cyclic nucleotide-binding domain-containing protein [Treponema sp.]